MLLGISFVRRTSFGAWSEIARLSSRFSSVRLSMPSMIPHVEIEIRLAPRLKIFGSLRVRMLEMT